MLQGNLKRLRTERGLSQEAMARELHVVRQTVSKWEKGSSVPDADMLKQIAALFGVSASQLLEEAEPKNLDEVALQLALLNERLANRERRMYSALKWVAGTLVVLLFVWLIIEYGNVVRVPMKEPETVLFVTCTLDGETYSYRIDCDEEGRAMSCSGDAWLHEQVVGNKYASSNGMGMADDLIQIIETYFSEQGGTVKVEKLDYDSYKSQKKSEQPIYAEER